MQVSRRDFCAGVARSQAAVDALFGRRVDRADALVCAFAALPSRVSYGGVRERERERERESEKVLVPKRESLPKSVIRKTRYLKKEPYRKRKLG